MSVAFRLGVMMFLEYVVWGAWLPLLGNYLSQSLKFSGSQNAWIFATPAVASVFALFVGGQIADRYLSGEKVLLISHVAVRRADVRDGHADRLRAGPGADAPVQLFYVPTLSVTNSIAFHNLAGREREFGRVRLFGTIGWIAASWPYVILLDGKTPVEMEHALSSIFVVSGIASLALAAFSFSLPKTPPQGGASSAAAPMKAMKLLAVPAFAVLFVVTLMDAMVHQAYFQFTSTFLAKAGLAESWIPPAMSIGQIAEILTMASLGLVLKRLGWRTTMIFGILGHAARFASSRWHPSRSAGDPGQHRPRLLLRVLLRDGLHLRGRVLPEGLARAAQGLFNLLILGIGPFIGAFVWGGLADKFTVAGAVDFHKLFLFPAGLALAAALLLLVAFHPKETVPAAAKAA